MLMWPPAACAALDRISHGVDFRHHPIETALNWGEPDPLAPPVSRPRRFHFREFRFGANDGARAFAANDRSYGRRGAGERSAVQPAKALKDQRNSWFVGLFGAAVQPLGHRQSMALKDQQKGGRVNPYGAESPRARSRQA